MSNNSAKGKAESLFKAMLEHIPSGTHSIESRAIKCAIVCVDEKIKTLKNIIGDQGELYTSHEAESLLELQQIKSELNQL